MASSADAREAEVSATLNLFNKEEKRDKNVEEVMGSVRQVRLVYLFLKQILGSPNRRGGSGGAGSGGLLCR